MIIWCPPVVTHPGQTAPILITGSDTPPPPPGVGPAARTGGRPLPSTLRPDPSRSRPKAHIGEAEHPRKRTGGGPGRPSVPRRRRGRTAPTGGGSRGPIPPVTAADAPAGW